MRLSPKALAIVSAVLWGASILCVGLVHQASPQYGTAFLDAVSSFYPGFHGASSFADVLVGTGYGLVDGAAGGLVFAWLYNLAAPAAV